MLIKEGERGREFFVIVSGEVEVRRKGRKVATLGPGNFVGEMALLSKAPRTATVTAADAARRARDHRPRLPRPARQDAGSGPSDWFDARERVAGWRATLDDAGVAWHEPLAGDWSAERGYDVGARLVAEGLPSAIFAGNDQLALGLLHAFWDAGVRVPDDVSVVGFDDVAGSDHFIPPLTTVRQHFGRLGRRAIDVLTGLLEGEERDLAPLTPDLRVRASTAPPRP